MIQIVYYIYEEIKNMYAGYDMVITVIEGKRIKLG